MLPFAAGCSPELLVGGAIVGSVLYAHMNKDNLPARREPVLHEPRTYYANPGGANRVYTASNPPVQRTEQRSEDRAVTASPIMEGARAYRELRWEDAVRILGRAIDTGACTESELGQAHILLGAIAYQQGDAESARRHFVQAHRHDPQLQPSPELFPPMIFHLSDGEGATDATAIAEEMKRQSTADGNVLVVNAYIGTQTSLSYNGPGDFPGYVDVSEAGSRRTIPDSLR